MTVKKVFVSGCFDIIHGGHVEFFNQAKAVGGDGAILIVSFANDDVLMKYKGRRSPLPERHKKNLLESISVIDTVVVGSNTEEDGLDFIDHFVEMSPDYLVVTEDDKFEIQKRELCSRTGAEYVVLPKTLHYEKISTTDLIGWIRAPKRVPLRVDFCGGWLDVPKYSGEGYVINCSISPTVSLTEWNYNIKSGLGGSAAYSVLTGKDAVRSELSMGVGWQDPAIICETGLCIWKSGPLPDLMVKMNPSRLNGLMALYWTGNSHDTPSNVDIVRDYRKIIDLSVRSRRMIESRLHQDIHRAIAEIINGSYDIQIEEGMNALDDFGSIGKKYCGGGWGGYALYIFSTEGERNSFCDGNPEAMRIEPYMKRHGQDEG